MVGKHDGQKFEVPYIPFPLNAGVLRKAHYVLKSAWNFKVGTSFLSRRSEWEFPILTTPNKYGPLSSFPKRPAYTPYAVDHHTQVDGSLVTEVGILLLELLPRQTAVTHLFCCPLLTSAGALCGHGRGLVRFHGRPRPRVHDSFPQPDSGEPCISRHLEECQLRREKVNPTSSCC